jgi:HAD superfamily hydrolase (TIGR01662 family)
MQLFSQYFPTLAKDFSWDQPLALPDATRLLIVDVDGTLTLDGSKQLHPDAVRQIKACAALGITVHLLTNNKFSSAERFDYICTQIDASGWSRATPRKPSPKPFCSIIEQYHASPQTTVVIGDQLLTDIRGGNRAGCHTLLMKKPQTEPLFMKPIRGIESLITVLAGKK